MLLFKLALVLVIFASLQLTQACLLDSTCLPSQYCETSFPNPIGKCVDGLEEGKACLRDRTCASKQCSFFRCKKRVGVSNGPCKHSADCLNTQYCDDIPGIFMRKKFWFLKSFIKSFI